MPFAKNKINKLIDRLLAASGWLEIEKVVSEFEQAFGPKDVRAVPALIGILAQRNAWLRSAAALALGAIGPAANRAVPHLVPALRDKNAQVRHDAAMALKQIRPQDPDVIRRLFRRLLDDDDDVQGAAEEALVEILKDYKGPDAARFKRRLMIWRGDW